MAYCRFSDTCRVYMYASIKGGYQFHLSGEVRNGETDFNIIDPKAALRKLKELQTQGFGVPNYAVKQMQQEVDDLPPKRNLDRKTVARLQASNAQLQAERDELVELVKTNQWVEYNDPDYGTQRFCPDCRNDKKHGHLPECGIGKAFAKIEGSKT